MTLLRPPSADYAIVLVCNDRFTIGAEVLISSVRRHLPKALAVDWKVFFGGGICQLSDKSITRLKAQVADIDFIEVPDDGRYVVKVGNLDHRPALLKMEMLRLAGYRAVIYLDCDILCVGDISPLFNISGAIGMAVCRNPTGGRYNTGVMAVDGALLKADVHSLAVSEIVDTTSYMLDQPILNRLFDTLGWNIKELEAAYNYQMIAGHPDIPDEHELEQAIDQIKLLHWCGHASRRKKPWEITSPELLSWRLWRDAANMIAERRPQSLAEGRL